MKVSESESLFKTLLLKEPQESILVLILFNLFINDSLLFINESKLENLADCNTVYPARRDLNKLSLLKEKIKMGIQWFSDSDKIVNP